jgi:hypothetical protein
VQTTSCTTLGVARLRRGGDRVVVLRGRRAYVLAGCPPLGWVVSELSACSSSLYPYARPFSQSYTLVGLHAAGSAAKPGLHLRLAALDLVVRGRA